jgi:2'-5' RNA ligase
VTSAALRPSAASALIIRVDLPRDLEALRMRQVADAANGLPAHITVLFPFAEPGSIDDAVLRLIGDVVARHARWTMRLVGRRRWPGVVFAAVEPEAPAIALQADLAAAFPSLPIYGATVEAFVPHVTVAEGGDADDPAIDEDPGWTELPVERAVDAVELIIQSAAGRWRVERRFPMRG